MTPENRLAKNRITAIADLPDCVRPDMAVDFMRQVLTAIQNLKPGYWIHLSANGTTYWLGGISGAEPCQCQPCSKARTATYQIALDRIQEWLDKQRLAKDLSLFNAKDRS